MSAASYGSDLRSHTLRIRAHDVGYVEAGAGVPIVFLHGNPTSSYLWRNVIPHVTRHGRCIALDLIGMGASGKLPGRGDDRYRFDVHRSYLDAFLTAVVREQPVVLVGHDWGGVLAMDWAFRHQQAVRGLAYMETFVRTPTWEEYEEGIRGVFEALRSEAGEQMCLLENFFVEQMLPAGTLRALSTAELDVYRAPFSEPGEGRRPTLSWARQVPLGGQPADVTNIIDNYGRWLADSPLPKLHVRADPGQIMAREAQYAFCRSWPNQQEVVVPGLHFLQEDSPREVGEAIAAWVEGIRAT